MRRELLQFTEFLIKRINTSLTVYFLVPKSRMKSGLPIGGKSPLYGLAGLCTKKRVSLCSHDPAILLRVQFTHCSHLQTELLATHSLFWLLSTLELHLRISPQTPFLWFYKYRRAHVLLVVTSTLFVWKSTMPMRDGVPNAALTCHTIGELEPDQKELKPCIHAMSTWW